ncbi:MAG: hypothetical protein ACYS17_15025 [Planctomycetota bacterium]
MQACLEALKKAGVQRFGKIDKESELGQFLQWGYGYIEGIDLLAPVDEMKDDRELYNNRIVSIARQRNLR